MNLDTIFFNRIECEDAHWKLYWLLIVTGEAEPQEGGGIARAWIADPKVYPGIPMMVLMPAATVVATCGRFVKMWGVFFIVLTRALLAAELVSFPQNTTKKLKTTKYT